MRGRGENKYNPLACSARLYLLSHSSASLLPGSEHHRCGKRKMHFLSLLISPAWTPKGKPKWRELCIHWPPNECTQWSQQRHQVTLTNPQGSNWHPSQRPSAHHFLPRQALEVVRKNTKLATSACASKPASWIVSEKFNDCKLVCSANQRKLVHKEN